jgi:transposase
VSKLDAQDAGQSERGRKAGDRGAYSRFQHAIAEAKLTRFVQADYQADRFSYAINETAMEDAERYDGKLVVLTHVLDFSAEHVIERYKSLVDIERGFRVLKNDIDIAPVFHRLPERIRAHALICFLALVLYRVMRMRLKAYGSIHSPKTTLELLRRLQKHRVQLGEQHLTGIGKTSPQQLELFEALGINQPT